MKNFATSLLFLLVSLPVFAQPKLSSYPQAKATIFLDFDGHYVAGTPWNGGQPFECAPSGLTNDQITEVFHRVAEDFRPFEINITTDSTVYLAAPLIQRVRVIITPTSGWYQNVGGVSFTRSFTWGDGTPAFVFPDRLLWSPKIIAECCSHEAGHTLGLSHQAKYNDNCSLLATYNDGKGTGETGWAPVMGNSYNRNFSGWNNGPTPSGCYADQDNLSIITGINGFGYRPDDHSDDPRNGATKISFVETDFKADGIITTSDDKDAFEFHFSEAGNLHFAARPFSVGLHNEGANLDVKVVVLNGGFEEVATFDPQDKLDVYFELGVSPGKYFVVVEGAANENTSNYGSLGAYSISGSFRTFGAMPVNLLSLKGSAAGEKHKLVWDLVCDESIGDQEIEVSTDGQYFRNLVAVPPTARQFAYDPVLQQDLYYRIKVTTLTGNSTFSNVVMLKKPLNAARISLKSTVVSDRIEIRSDQNFQFILSDTNGKILKRGNGTGGLNVINVSNSPDGIYIVQILSNSQRITHRVVKM